jgi:hypothetical protein
LQTQPKDADLIKKPIENYAHMKIIYTMGRPAAPISSSAVHHVLSHLMDHKAQANMYLVMTPKDRMAWFTAFIRKYYL